MKELNRSEDLVRDLKQFADEKGSDELTQAIAAVGAAFSQERFMRDQMKRARDGLNSQRAISLTPFQPVNSDWLNS
jgi:hypothetical protein